MIRPLVFAGAAAALAAGGLAAFSGYTARRVERRLPPRGHFIEIDGHRMHYLDAGVGPAVLLVHGLGGQAGNFTHSLVARLTDTFRVIVLERPGSGYSTRAWNASARLRPQAAIVARFIEAMQLERPLVVGHSLGGAVALALALDHPECVAALALISPITHEQHAVPPPFAALAIPSPLVRAVVAWTIAVPLGMLRHGAVLPLLFDPDRVPSDYATAGGGLLSLRPRSFYGASTDMAAANADLPSMVARYPSLRMPVAILFGTGDRVLDYRANGLAMHDEVPSIRVELIEGGHMLPVSAPDRCAQFVRSLAREFTVPGATVERAP